MKLFMHDDVQDFISSQNYAPIMGADVNIHAELDQRIVTFGELVSHGKLAVRVADLCDKSSALPRSAISGEMK